MSSTTAMQTAQFQNLAAAIIGKAGLTTGDVYYVSSTATNKSDATKSAIGTNGRGRSPKYPFATIDYAIGQCTASNGDVIIVMPGHAETIAAAGGIACDVAGITIIGLGNGDNRPTISFSTTDSTMTVSANNVTIKNIITIPSVDEVVSAILVTGTYCTLDGVDVYPVTSKQMIQWLLTTSAASYLTIKNCYHRQSAASASAQLWIQLVGTTGTRIVDNDIDILANASASSILINGSTAVVDCEIARNLMRWRGASIISIVSCATTSTGIISDNRGGITSTSGAITDVFTGDAMFKFQNFAINVAGTASGLLTPALGTYT